MVISKSDCDTGQVRCYKLVPATKQPLCLVWSLSLQNRDPRTLEIDILTHPLESSLNNQARLRNSQPPSSAMATPPEEGARSPGHRIELVDDNPSPRHDGENSPGLRNSKGWDGKLRVPKSATLANPEALSDPEYSDEDNVAPGDEVAADEGKKRRQRS